MRIWLVILVIASSFLVGCSEEKQIEIGLNLSDKEQKIAFKRVLEEQYKLGDYTNSFKNFEKIAKQGNEDANFFLAICYKDGRGVEKNKEKSIEILKDLSKQNFPAAKALLAQIYAKNPNKENNENWLQITTKMAEAGSKKAWFGLADYYEKNGNKELQFKSNLMLAQHFFEPKFKLKVLKSFVSGQSGSKKDLREAIYWVYRQNPALKSVSELSPASELDMRLLDFAISQKQAQSNKKVKFRSNSLNLPIAQNTKILELNPQEIQFALTAGKDRQDAAIELLKKYLRENFEKNRQVFIKEKDGRALLELALNEEKQRSRAFPDSSHTIQAIEDAANLGEIDAMLELGDRLTRENKSKDLFMKGFNYLLKAMESGKNNSYTKISRLINKLETFPKEIAIILSKNIIEQLEKGVKKGSPDAMLEMVNCLEQIPGEEDSQRIEELLSNASALGNPKACYKLANRYLENPNIEKSKIVSLLEAAAQKGHAKSIMVLFEINNKQIETYTYDQTLKWVEIVPRRDLPELYLFLIKHYFENKKFQTAYRWAEKTDYSSLSTEQQRVKRELISKIAKKISQAEMHTILSSEIESEQIAEANLRKKAIENEIQTKTGIFAAILKYNLLKDISVGENKLALSPIYEKLKTMAQKDPKFSGYFLGEIQNRSYSHFYNPKEAIQNFTRSANQGNPYSMVELANLLQSTAKDPFNCPEADKWFSEAFSYDLEEAQLQMGYKYIKTGKLERAFYLFTELANKNNLWGILTLAGLYEDGQGTEKNLYQAVALYQKAAQKNLALYPFYKRALDELNKNPMAEAIGPFMIEKEDPAAETAKRLADIDTFFDQFLDE